MERHISTLRQLLDGVRQELETVGLNNIDLAVRIRNNLETPLQNFIIEQRDQRKLVRAFTLHQDISSGISPFPPPRYKLEWINSSEISSSTHHTCIRSALNVLTDDGRDACFCTNSMN